MYLQTIFFHKHKKYTHFKYLGAVLFRWNSTPTKINICERYKKIAKVKQYFLLENKYYVWSFLYK